MNHQIDTQTVGTKSKESLPLKPSLKHLRSITRLSEPEIEKKPDEYQKQLVFYQSYLYENIDILPRSLITAYKREIKAGILKLRGTAVLRDSRHEWDLADNKSLTYSAIICLYKRSSVDDVMKALWRQTIAPRSIMILINGTHIDPNEVRQRYPEALVTQTDINSLYTRWCLGYVLEGDYIYVCDDDQTPGCTYLERALRLSAEKRALICGTGRRYNKDGKRGFYELVSPYNGEPDGYNRLHSMPMECDWGCNSYLFRKDWIHFILSDRRYKDYQLKVDDIQLAVNLYAFGGITCWVGVQDPSDINSLHSTEHELSVDQHALWKKNDHFPMRKEYVEYLVGNGLYTPFYARRKKDV